MLTDEQMREWKRAADGATAGPWEAANVSGWLVLAGPLTENTPGRVRGGRGGIAEMDSLDLDEDDQERNAAFIAAAREAMPALLAEVERLRTPASENVGRVGYEARAAALGGYVDTGFPRRVPLAVWDILAPGDAAPWVAAGHAERAVAYALAAQHIAGRQTWVAHDRRDVLADELRALGQPPANATDRLTRIAALLREAGSLAVEVLADGDAPPEQRATAEAIHRGIQEASGKDERPDAAHMRCLEVRRQDGPPGDDVPPSSEALKGAQASAATALEMARLAARRSSSLPLGRALGALESAGKQLAAAVKLEASPSDRAAEAWARGEMENAALRRVWATAQHEGAAPAQPWHQGQEFILARTPQPVPSGPPWKEDEEETPLRRGLRELTQASEDAGDYFGEEAQATAGVALLPDAAVVAAVAWWVALVREQRPDVPEQLLSAFSVALGGRIRSEMSKGRSTLGRSRISLRIDYEPKDILAEVMQSVGMTDGSPVMDRYLPEQKTRMVLSDIEATVTASVGRGAPFEQVWPTPDAEKTPSGPSAPLKDGDS